MKHVLWIAALLSISASAAWAQEVVIDFDDLPLVQLELPGGIIVEIPVDEIPLAAALPSDISPHATFSTEAGAGLYYFSGAGAVGTSSPNNITAAVDPNAFPYSADLYVDFTTPVNNLSFTVSSDNDAGVVAKVVVHHGSGQTANVDVIGNADYSDAIPMDLSGYGDVTRLEVVDITDTYGLSYDDFRFFPNPVPEPTAATLAASLIAMLLSRRRKCC